MSFLNPYGVFKKVLTLAQGALTNLSLKFLGDTDSGIYWVSANKWALVSGGIVVGYIYVPQAGDVQFQIDPSGTGTSTYPALAIVDAGAGWYKAAANDYRFTNGSAGFFVVNETRIGNPSDAKGAFTTSNSTATVPSVLPQNLDGDTGVGSAGADILSLIAGGVEGIRITEATYIKSDFKGIHGDAFSITSIEEAVTIAVGQGAAGVVTAGNLAPAGSLILGVAFRVTQAPGGGAATLDIGRTGGGNLDEFIDGASCDVLGETGNFYANHDAATTALFINTTADTLTLTTDANVTVSDMIIRVTTLYATITAPTS